MEGKMPNAGNKLVIEMAPWTNGDTIRAMTDEGLATVFEDYGDCPPRRCPYDNDGTSVKITRSDCWKCWLDWLRQEVTDG